MKYAAIIAMLTAVFGLCADNIYLRNQQEKQLNYIEKICRAQARYSMLCDDEKKECTATVVTHENLPLCPEGFMCKFEDRP
jgi:hypothetical protein